MMAKVLLLICHRKKKFPTFSLSPKFNHNSVRPFSKVLFYILVFFYYLTQYKDEAQKNERNGFWYFILIITLKISKVLSQLLASARSKPFPILILWLVFEMCLFCFVIEERTYCFRFKHMGSQIDFSKKSEVWISSLTFAGVPWDYLQLRSVFLLKINFESVQVYGQACTWNPSLLCAKRHKRYHCALKQVQYLVPRPHTCSSGTPEQL